jgi:hypothetical protein
MRGVENFVTHSACHCLTSTDPAAENWQRLKRYDWMTVSVTAADWLKLPVIAECA